MDVDRISDSGFNGVVTSLESAVELNKNEGLKWNDDKNVFEKGPKGGDVDPTMCG